MRKSRTNPQRPTRPSPDRKNKTPAVKTAGVFVYGLFARTDQKLSQQGVSVDDDGFRVLVGVQGGLQRIQTQGEFVEVLLVVGVIRK